MTKKVNGLVLLATASLMLVIPVTCILIQEFCGASNAWCQSNWNYLGSIGSATLIPFVLFFIFTIFVLFHPNLVKRMWFMYGTILTVATVLASFYLNSMRSSDYLDMQRSLYFYALYIVYLLISISIITAAVIRNRNKK